MNSGTARQKMHLWYDSVFMKCPESVGRLAVAGGWGKGKWGVSA